jgi:hypothetical protein
MTPSATYDDAHTTAVIQGLFKHFEGAPTQPPVTHNPGDEPRIYYDRSDELGHGLKEPKAPRHTTSPRPPRPDRGDRL